MELLTNRNTQLTPRTSFDGPTLTFDFPAVHIGVAEYDEGPTGCTVFSFPHGADTAVDERGGMVGKTGDYDWNHAICLAGGSLPGLEAAAGVSAAYFEQHGSSLDHMGLVSGAIIYDYGRRENRIYPDMALGRAALLASRPGVFPLGARGAGRSAGCGGVFDFARSEASGQGGAFRQVGPVKIAAFSVVNAWCGAEPPGRGCAGQPRPTNWRARPSTRGVGAAAAGGRADRATFGNTTLTVIVTNQKLDRRSLNQWARQVHSSLTRVICPFHTMMDGDVLYAVTTKEVEHPMLSVAALGMLASEVLWDAILSIYQ